MLTIYIAPQLQSYLNTSFEFVDMMLVAFKIYGLDILIDEVLETSLLSSQVGLRFTVSTSEVITLVVEFNST